MTLSVSQITRDLHTKYSCDYSVSHKLHTQEFLHLYKDLSFIELSLS